MANIQYQLTLQSEGVNSGPYYVVTYTTGSTYMPVIGGSPAYLPYPGSTAFVTIPSASYTNLGFKLNNGVGGGCELCDNDVYYIVAGNVGLPASWSFTYKAHGLGSNDIIGYQFAYASGSSGTPVAYVIPYQPDIINKYYMTGSSTATYSGSVSINGIFNSSFIYRDHCKITGSITSSYYDVAVYKNGNLIYSQSNAIYAAILPNCTGSDIGNPTLDFSCSLATGDLISIIWDDYYTTAPTPTPTPSPTPTPTPSPTPTPTPTPSPTPSSYYYYSVRQYDCGNSCAYVTDLVARSSVAKSTIDGVYYNPSGDGYVYQIQTEITPAPMSYDIDISSAPSNASCALACII